MYCGLRAAVVGAAAALHITHYTLLIAGGVYKGQVPLADKTSKIPEHRAPCLLARAMGDAAKQSLASPNDRKKCEFEVAHLIEQRDEAVRSRCAAFHRARSR